MSFAYFSTMPGARHHLGVWDEISTGPPVERDVNDECAKSVLIGRRRGLLLMPAATPTRNADRVEAMEKLGVFPLLFRKSTHRRLHRMAVRAAIGSARRHTAWEGDGRDP
jgi:hypothetical protein